MHLAVPWPEAGNACSVGRRGEAGRNFKGAVGRKLRGRADEGSLRVIVARQFLGALVSNNPAYRHGLNLGAESRADKWKFSDNFARADFSLNVREDLHITNRPAKPRSISFVRFAR